MCIRDRLYLAAVVDAREKLRAAKPEDKMAVFAVLMRLREICCDPLCRRAVRVSMGTVFQVPWAQIGTCPADWP